jgi:hypothetical protein
VEEKQDRLKVAKYMSREMGKAHQKQAPEGFNGVSDGWGVLGRQRGFVPVPPTEYDLSVEVAFEVGVRMRRWVRLVVASRGRQYDAGRKGWDRDGVKARG